MGVTATTRLPAGWYPDPDGGDRRRWWDGREWTQYTAAFQRPTSVDEIEPTQTKRKPGKKAAKTGSSKSKPVKPVRSTKASVGRKASPDKTTEATGTVRRKAAEGVGRLLAGATHGLSQLMRTGKRRRAHRSGS